MAAVAAAMVAVLVAVVGTAAVFLEVAVVLRAPVVLVAVAVLRGRRLGTAGNAGPMTMRGGSVGPVTRAAAR